MTDSVVFQDEDNRNVVGNIAIVHGPPKGMLAWLVQNKVVANAKQAETVLTGIAVVSIVLAVGIFFAFGVSHTTKVRGYIFPSYQAPRK